MNKQNDMWKRAVPKKPKLRTYCLFKETMGIENYIKYNLSSSERSAMAQFRFGILPLNIETRRFRNQTLEERLCTLCEYTIIRAAFVCLSVCLFVPYLLRGPLTDLRQTWWVYVGGPRNCP